MTTSSAALKCWGRNDEGQLGDGTDTDRATPVDVVGLSSDVANVALGGRHTCAITGTLGGVKCWGLNGFGQLGDGTLINRTTPVDVPFLSVGMTDIDAGFFHSCALTSGGFALCWGHNVFGQLGNGLTCPLTCTTPSNVQGLLGGVPTLHAGDFHSCAVISISSVKCWGYNLFGQVGDGTSGDNRPLPVDVLGVEPKPTPPPPTPTSTFTPTPIATPIPVGGIAKLPAAAGEPRGARTTDSNAILSAGSLAAMAGAILLIGATTYMLRRQQ